MIGSRSPYPQYPAIEFLRGGANDREYIPQPVLMSCAFCKHSIRFISAAELQRFADTSSVPGDERRWQRDDSGKVVCPVCQRNLAAGKEIRRVTR